MKKFISTDLGGAPIFKDDLKTLFNDEIWDVVDGLLEKANTVGIIVSGCVFTNNAGNFDMTAGIVYLNGEYLRIAAQTNQSFTKYIRAATATNDSRTFEDATTHAVVETRLAELNAAAGAGHNIPISSLTSMDSRRLNIIIGTVDSGDIDTTILASAFYSPTTDLDDFIQPGFQTVTNAAANAPNATGGNKWLVLIAKHDTNGSIVQTAIQTDGANIGDIFIRTFNPLGPTWSSWTTANT